MIRTIHMSHIRLTRRHALVSAAGAAGIALFGSTFQHAHGQTPVPAEGTPMAEPDVRQLIRVEYVGGFVPPEVNLLASPFYVLADNGLEVVTGPQIAIFPPPALPNLIASQLTDEGVAAILAAAEDAGLTGEDASYSNDLVADAATLVITIQQGDRQIVTEAYALDMLPPDVPQELGDARDRINAFLAVISEPASMRPTELVAEAEMPYDYEEIEIVVFPEPTGGEFSGLDVAWPLDTRLDEIGVSLGEAPGGENFAQIFPDARVAILSGDDLEAVVDAAMDANQLTPWSSNGDTYQVLFRPLLPGEIGPLARPADDARG